MSYVYEPLVDARHIRLLRVFWDAQQSDVMNCEFKIMSINDPDCDFIAISYMWGSPAKTHEVLCGGQTIEVTASAMSILSNIASKRTLEYIWIDGVCIDQGNDVEKGMQVRLMADIYSNAKSVIAWLGGPDADTEEALNFVQVLRVAVHDVLEPGTIKFEKSALVQRPNCESPSHRWRALTKLLRNPYFGRCWVLQEMVLADGAKIRLSCGSSSLPWAVLAHTVAMLNVNGMSRMFFYGTEGLVASLPSGITSLTTAWTYNLLRKTGKRPRLADLLSEFTAFQASDARDKVFAALSMACDAEDQDFQPNYMISVSELYRKVAVRLLTRDESSEQILYHAGIGIVRDIPGLPSWAPDWSRQPKHTIFGSTSKLTKYRASGNALRASGFQYDDRLQTIRMAGIVTDIVTSLAAPCPEIPLTIAWEDVQRAGSTTLVWLDSLQHLWNSSGTHPTGLPYYPDVLWRTLIANSTGLLPAPTTYLEHFLNYFELPNWFPRMSQEEFMGKFGAKLESVQSYSQALSLAAIERKPFATGQGYIGLGPLGMEAGDRLCIFLGLDVPFIIRPRQGGGYALVGECYVYGLMDAEALVDGVVEDITLY